MRETYINNFNKIFRTDPYVKSLVNSIGIEMDNALVVAQKIYANMFFDTMTEDLGIPIYANTLKLNLREDLTLDEKRSIIEAKWKSKGKCNEELMQAIADSWKYGAVKVDMVDGRIKFNFIASSEIPTDLSGLKNALAEVKPAYLLIDYIFNYLFWEFSQCYAVVLHEMKYETITIGLGNISTDIDIFPSISLQEAKSETLIITS